VGKSSLSFALAGLFGLDIYVISLLDPLLTESDLSMLFNNLPRRCVVLLEDIDSAGISRGDDNDDAERGPKPTRGKPESSALAEAGKSMEASNFAADLAMELRRARRTGGTGDDANKTGISLSGLLNAIDGVASHEGRVLVMTTNHPEKLDKALIRPGRVDMQIEFKNASRQQARDIFLRMYSDDVVAEQGAPDALADSEKSARQSSVLSLLTHLLGREKLTAAPRPPSTAKENVTMHGHDRSDDTTTTSKTPLLTPPQAPGLAPTTPQASHSPAQVTDHITETSTTPDSPPSQDELRKMAEVFADMIPERVFSPAELQSFLIMRKKSPRRALEDVEGWREELEEAKGVEGVREDE